MTNAAIALARPWIACALLLAAAAGAHAQTLRWAVRGDAESMDPHAFIEGVSINVNLLVHDALVERDQMQRIVPALATRWERIEPRRWRFELRRDVRFHDGTPMDADDVVFSILRAQQPTSQFAIYAQPLGEPVRIDAHTIELRQREVNPLLLDHLAVVLVMSRRWAEAHQSTRVPDFKAKDEAASSREAMGTGRYRLVSRQPGVRTVLARHAAHWAPRQGNVERIELVPIANDATRMAALLAGDVDLVQDVSPQDVPRLKREPGLRLFEATETRVMYLGMDLSRDQLLYGSVKDRNPLKDVRVREALALALDPALLVRTILHGRAEPTRCMAILKSACLAPELEAPLKPDPDRAKALLAQAGYPEGFDLTLDCPTDRYVLGHAVCTALVGPFARIGVRLTVDARPKSIYFPKVFSNDTSFFYVGVGGSIADAQVLMDLSMHSQDPARKKGSLNFGRFTDAELDRLIDDAGSEADPAARAGMIRDAQRRMAAQHHLLPLFRPMLTWATRARVQAVVTPNNLLRADWIRID
ncbi:ABC transporter substrate-binding protein [Aquincola sp. MAHUQ-54]|uniref:ABC transporter substrate-binding protein n=1 Tax=Aquincola agrisoli TaxID=3119538 RepID=A0AAW9QH04_9BURK